LGRTSPVRLHRTPRPVLWVVPQAVPARDFRARVRQD